MLVWLRDFIAGLEAIKEERTQDSGEPYQCYQCQQETLKNRE